MSETFAAAVVDSLTLMCVAMNERASDLYLLELSRVGALYISAVTLSETMLVAMSFRKVGLVDSLRSLIATLDLNTIDYVAADVPAYLKGAGQYHLKAVPPGPLNMGDLFSFHLAQKMDLPPFFQGMGFLQTPVKNAMLLRGYLMNVANKGVPSVPAAP
jgi:ribonuclease VapC